jgi:ATP-dependent Clp protease protease subunit
MTRKPEDTNDWDVDGILQRHGIFHIFGEIDASIAEDAIKFIFAHNLNKRFKLKHLTFVVNSQGGSLTDAFAVIDTMRHSGIPVHTLGIGQISSAGLMIFMAGAANARILTKNTTIMSHQWSGSATGKMHELISAQQDFEQTTARMMDHYRKFSGLADASIQTHLLPAHDVYLTAEQAVKLGIADKIQS